jgi:hypothetical protein
MQIHATDERQEIVTQNNHVPDEPVTIQAETTQGDIATPDSLHITDEPA